MAGGSVGVDAELNGGVATERNKHKTFPQKLTPPELDPVSRRTARLPPVPVAATTSRCQPPAYSLI